MSTMTTAIEQLQESAPTFTFVSHRGEVSDMYTRQEHGIVVPSYEAADTVPTDDENITVERDPVEAVAYMYGDSNRSDKTGRSLKGYTSWLPADSEQAREAVEQIPPYNCYDPGLMSQTLSEFPPSLISVARESSVALYFWTEQPRLLMDTLDEMQFEDDVDTESAFAPRGPDELGATPAGEAVWPGTGTGSREVIEGLALVRAWWD